MADEEVIRQLHDLGAAGFIAADHAAKIQAEIHRHQIAYLRKPIKTNDLFALIHKVIGD